jgi:hypothetical protein
MTKKAERALDKAIEQEWYRQGFGVQVDIMDIPKIFRDVRAAMLAGGEGDVMKAAVAEAVKKYRKN